MAPRRLRAASAPGRSNVSGLVRVNVGAGAGLADEESHAYRRTPDRPAPGGATAPVSATTAVDASGIPRAGRERRAEPRLPLDAPVTVRGPASSARGHTVDASSVGLLVELDDALSFLSHEVGVELALADGGTVTLEANVVRRSLSAQGRVMLALRLVGAPGGRALRRAAAAGPRPAPRRRRPSRARPRVARPAALAREEIRALGTRVLELAIVDPDAPPPGAMVGWLAALAAELGLPRPAATGTNRLMVRAIVDLHRRAGEGAAAQR
jgi:hypothetical protein